MSSPTLQSLIASLSKAQIFQKLLDVCDALGLETESWQSGDPTRTFLDAAASRFADWENSTTGFPAMVAGGLLAIATGDWLTILLDQNYNVQRRTATFATCAPDTSGAGGFQIVNGTAVDQGHFDIGDLRVQNPHVTGFPTFTNTVAFDLGPNATVVTSVQAEASGSGSNSTIGQIDTLVSPGMSGVTVSNLSSATAQDDESDADARARGQSKLESVSPAGPRKAYTYFLTTPELQADGSNQTNVTRVLALEESDYGDAIIFIAGASGALSGADVTKAQNTLEGTGGTAPATGCHPLVVNGQVLTSSNLAVNVTYELWVYSDINLTAAQIQTVVSNALTAAFAKIPIGGNIIPPATSGNVYVDWIKARILEAVDTLADGVTLARGGPYGFKCNITAPAADVPVTVTYVPTNPSGSTAQVPTLGSVTCTAIHLVTR